MSILQDIRYALKRARSERYIEEQLERYEASLLECVKAGVRRLPPAPMPLSTPARSGGDPLTSAEYDRLDAARHELHRKYSGFIRNGTKEN